MTKREQKSLEKFVEHTENAIKNRGYYMPSDAQTHAIKALCAEIAPVFRDYTRLAQLVMSIDAANRNEVYAVCATPAQLSAVKRAITKAASR